jgi:hypothetical protein
MNPLMLVWSWSLWCLHRASMLGAVWALPMIARSLDVFFLWCVTTFGEDCITAQYGALSRVHATTLKAAHLAPDLLLAWDDLMRERAPVKMLLAVARVNDERPLWASVVRVTASAGVNVVLALILACGAALALPVLLALVLTEAVFVLAEAARGRVSPP